MLDWRRVIQDIPTFKKALAARGFSETQIAKVSAEIGALAEVRVKMQAVVNGLQSDRNKLSQKVGELMKERKKNEATSLIEQGKILGEKISVLEKDLAQVEDGFRAVLEVVPNLPHESVPLGKSTDDNRVVREWGTKREFSFSPQSHDELAAKNRLIDFDRGGKTSGARFTFLRAGLAQLERALVNFMLDVHRTKGYEEISVPYIVTEKTMYGTGQLPKFREDIFKVEGQDKFLIPTAEIPVTSFYSDEILREEALPRKFMAYSACFRSEAGSYGKDTKGLIRQHQFHKVELLNFTHPDSSLDALEAMTVDAENILRLLEIPFRTVLLCTGDMGQNSRKTYDIEVWLPGSIFESQGNKRGCYREISSCSDIGDYQARRAQIRFKEKGGKGTRFVHTLNGSGLAVGRTLVAVVENYQQADGTITVPKALVPYMNGQLAIEPLPAAVP